MKDANASPDFGKIRDVLSSFEAKSNEKSPKTEKIEERALAEMTSEREGFLERLSTFCVTKWRSYSVSPLLCAQYGWRCEDVCLLKCSRCKALVNGAVPFPSAEKIYEERLQVLKDKIVNAHNEYCSWKLNPSPEALLIPQIPYSSSKALRWVRDRAVNIYAENNPIPDFSISSSLEKVVASIGSWVFDCVGETCTPKQRLTLALVLHGWMAGTTPNSLGCDFCKREVGIWNFCMIASVPVLKVTEPDGTPSTQPVEEKSSSFGQEGSCASSNGQPSKESLSPSSQEKAGSGSPITRSRSRSGQQLGDKEETRVSPRRSPRRDSGTSKTSPKQLQKSPERSKGELQIPSRSEAGENTEENRVKVDDPEKAQTEEKCGTPKRGLVSDNDVKPKRMKNLDVKLHFDPVKEHRSWCTWVSEPPRMFNDKEDTLKCASEELLQIFRANDPMHQDGLSPSKYADPVDGLHNLRKIMSEWSSPIVLD